MDITRLRYGMVHSLIGKNDGVSIVIDQTIMAMNEQLGIPLDNMYFLAGHSAPRMNTTTHDIFWHRNEQNQYILERYSGSGTAGLEEYIIEHAMVAKKVIAEFVEENNLDVLIVHNSCHPSNFVFAVAMGMYFEDRRAEGLILPRYLLWWHDSHFERARFKDPNEIIKKYLHKYVPGPNVDGIVFINSEQAKIGPVYYEQLGLQGMEQFFERKTCVIPNTCDIHWDWKQALSDGTALSPTPDQYDRTFLKDVGIVDALEEKGYSVDECAILLQHTRVVQRKRIDYAIDFAFEMRKKFVAENNDKAIVLLVSGHSGDEHDPHRKFLEDYFADKVNADPETGDKILFVFGEHIIFPAREVLVNRKFYRFGDIPDVVAELGGIGTYFSEVEGFGNNLLEMMAGGLPVIINEYEIYTTDIEQFGFDLILTKDGNLTQEAIDQSYKMLTDPDARRETVRHNLQTLEDKLDHHVMAKSLGQLTENLFRYR